LRYASTRFKSKTFYASLLIIQLLDLFMNRMALEIRIVLLQQKPLGGVLLVFCCRVS